MEVVSQGERHILVLRITPSQVPPIVKVNSVAWVRKGSTTCRATEEDLARLQERRPLASLASDARPLAEATADDLDDSAFRQQYEAERHDDDNSATFPPLINWLANRRQLGRLVEGTWRPTAAAILVYGKSPQDWLPGAVVEIARYAGTDVDSRLVWRRQAAGTLPNQLETIWALSEANLDEVPLQREGIREGFASRYPAEALKELARNMVQHRMYEGTNAPGRIEWFNDRIEFSNPGGPFGRASEGAFGEHSDYRNPSVTRELVELGYVQQLGRGVRRTQLELAKNGNPPAEFALDGFTRVTVRSRA